MKSQIDNIVREINRNLRESNLEDPQMVSILNLTRMGGIPRAIDLRNFLVNWTKDVNINADVREYAQEQLNALPLFG